MLKRKGLQQDPEEDGSASPMGSAMGSPMGTNNNRRKARINPVFDSEFEETCIFRHHAQQVALQVECMHNHGTPPVNMNWMAELHRKSRQNDATYSLDRDGHVMSFGDNDLSQLGLRRLIDEDGDDKQPQVQNESNVPPESVTSLHDADYRQVACGGAHSIVLQTDKGIPYTWGVGDYGCLGRMGSAPDGNMTEREQKMALPVTGFVDHHTGKSQDEEIIQVAAGNTHSLFLSLTGNVYCTGFYNDMDSGKFRPSADPQDCCGSFATPHRMDCFPGRPIRIFSGSGANYDAVLCEKDDGTQVLVTYGFGNKGELARSATMPGAAVPNASPVKYNLDKDFFYDLETGKPDKAKVHRLFLTPQPVVWADGRLHSQRTVVEVACGAYHLLVTARDNQDASGASKLYTSGLNQYGQLGLGDQIDRHALTLVTALEDENIAYVAAGEHHSLVCSLDGRRVFSFGRADYGQLGLARIFSTGEYELTPQLVAFPPDELISQDRRQRIVSISCGDRHSMAINDAGQVFTWGFNETSPTGHKTKGDKDVIQPALLTFTLGPTVGHIEALQVAGGGQHSLALVRRYAPHNPEEK